MSTENRTDRRSILKAGAALAAAAVLPMDRAAWGQAPPAQEPAPLFKISLAQWSFHNALYAKKLDHLDFPKTAKGLGIEACEYVNTFFKDKALDQAYLRELKKRCDDLGVRSVLIMCDAEGNLGDPDEKKRVAAAENHHKWVEAAKFLGCHSIRVNAYSEGSFEEQQKLASDGLRRLVEFAAPRDMNVIVENHGGFTSNGAWMAGVMKLVGHPRIGTLPDFGNFNISKDEKYDRYKGVAEMMPFARGASAKCYDFDASDNETTIDYGRMLRVVLRAGYRGHLGIEYEGTRLSEEDGVKACKRLLERLREELSKPGALDAPDATTPAAPPQDSKGVK